MLAPVELQKSVIPLLAATTTARACFKMLGYGQRALSGLGRLLGGKRRGGVAAAAVHTQEPAEESCLSTGERFASSAEPTSDKDLHPAEGSPKQMVRQPSLRADEDDGVDATSESCDTVYGSACDAPAGNGFIDGRLDMDDFSSVNGTEYSSTCSLSEASSARCTLRSRAGSALPSPYKSPGGPKHRDPWHDLDLDSTWALEVLDAAGKFTGHLHNNGGGGELSRCRSYGGRQRTHEGGSEERPTKRSERERLRIRISDAGGDDGVGSVMPMDDHSSTHSSTHRSTHNQDLLDSAVQAAVILNPTVSAKSPAGAHQQQHTSSSHTTNDSQSEGFGAADYYASSRDDGCMSDTSTCASTISPYPSSAIDLDTAPTPHPSESIDQDTSSMADSETSLSSLTPEALVQLALRLGSPADLVNLIQVCKSTADLLKHEHMSKLQDWVAGWMFGQRRWHTLDRGSAQPTPTDPRPVFRHIRYSPHLALALLDKLRQEAGQQMPSPGQLAARTAVEGGIVGLRPWSEACWDGYSQPLIAWLAEGAHESGHTAAVLQLVLPLQYTLEEGGLDWKLGALRRDLWGSWGDWLLVKASRQGHVGVARLLLAQGAAADAWGGIALHYAMEARDREMIRVMVKYWPEGQGFTYLGRAVEQLESVTEGCGSDPGEGTDGGGEEEGPGGKVRQLVEFAEACAGYVVRNGSSCAAADSGSGGSARLPSAAEGECLVAACASGDLLLVTALLARGADFGCRYGGRALLAAVSGRVVEVEVEEEEEEEEDVRWAAKKVAYKPVVTELQCRLDQLGLRDKVEGGTTSGQVLAHWLGRETGCQKLFRSCFRASQPRPSIHSLWAADPWETSVHNHLRTRQYEQYKEVLQRMEHLVPQDCRAHVVHVLLQGSVLPGQYALRVLSKALQRGCKQVSEMLLAYCQDSYVQDVGVLVQACRDGDIPVVEMLVQQGADLRAKGGASLVSACGSGQVDLVLLLLSRHLNLSDAHDRGACVHGLLEACSIGNEEVVGVLVREAGLSGGSEGGKPLVRACHAGHAEVVEMLMKSGAAVPTAAAVAGLRVATAKLHKKVVEVLLRYGVDARGAEGLPLALANLSRHGVGIVGMLVAKGARAGDVCGALQNPRMLSEYVRGFR